MASHANTTHEFDSAIAVLGYCWPCSGHVPNCKGYFNKGTKSVSWKEGVSASSGARNGTGWQFDVENPFGFTKPSN